MEIFVGIVSIVLGVLLCLRGVGAARLLMSVWGGFVGFLIGFAIVSAVLTDNAFGTIAAVIVGVVFGLIGAWFTRAYWIVAVVVTIGSLGFILATALMGVIGINFNWFVAIIGVIAGVTLAYYSARSDVPARLLMIIMSLIGAGAVVFGLLLVLDRVNFNATNSQVTANIVSAEPWWILVYLGVALAGIIAQGAFTSRGTRAARELWQGA